MTYLKWLILTLVDIALLITVPFVPPAVAAFCKAMPYGLRPYSWGGWWGTWDNPPQGDQGFVSKHAFFPGVIDGWRGYVNRVQWMWRNKLYGFAKLAGVQYLPGTVVIYSGNPDISDKYKRPGWYFARAYYAGRLTAFEFYAVLPYTESRDVRIRLGWKIMTDKFQRFGFGQHVFTFNPFDGYGEE